ncbi:MAG TPA: 16S rRNA (guanine(966)-N(2))-methyltransferase RsmD [Candidatus Dormibacteraeota bacterium]|nr:16S rRNA (guanine(966)-N(2))-methyltransferase RsmD [Candidatus Dormibacteraeota bacterium]
MPKITGGDLNSRRLKSPKGNNVRPTPGRVKESLFAILTPGIGGSHFLDLFAGTGAIGFEAASRGAKHVVGVEGHRETALAIAASAEELGLRAQNYTLVAAPVERALYRVTGPFDFVYLDPPYADPVPLQAFRLLIERDLLAPDATVIYEHSAKRILPTIPGYRSVREEVYGDVALAFFAPENR